MTDGTPLMVVLSAQPFHMPSEEIVHFDYFRTVCIPEFSGFFVTTLWNPLILQFAHSESFVMNAALGIGALRRFQLETDDFSHVQHGRTAPPCTINYSLSKYNMALRDLSNRIRTNDADPKLGIIGSIVFLAVEVLQGNEIGALTHMSSGSALLKSLSYSNCALPPGQPLSRTGKLVNLHSRISDFDDLGSAFTRLSVEEYTYVGSGASTHDTALPEMPSHFLSIIEAGRLLNNIIAFMYALFRRSAQPNLRSRPLDCLLDTIPTQVAQLQILLHLWLCTFNAFLSRETYLYLEDSTTRKDVLLVQHLVAWVKMSTYLQPGQMAYDIYLDQFQRIVDMTERVLKAGGTPWNKALLRGPCFALDIALAQPLYFVARRCRNPALRRRAIDIMKGVGKGGIYTGMAIAKVAQWIVMNEEAAGFQDGVLLEEGRFHDVTFEFDRVDRTATILATRMTPSGIWQELSEVLDVAI